MNRDRIAFVGAGNMARALAGGLLRAGARAADLIAADPVAQQREQLAALGVAVCDDNAEAIESASVVVLAVKPQVMRDVVVALAPNVTQQHLVISIAAGVPIGALEQWLPVARSIVRCMPNTPALYGAGITAMYANAAVTARQRALAESVLAGAGEVVWVQDESQLDAVTAVSGSGPAYYFYLMEAMQRAARTLGLDDDLARKLTLATAHGAAVMARESRDGVAQLRKNVTSPGGTTERAISVLDARSVAGAFEDAIVAAAKRSRELAAEAGKP